MSSRRISLLKLIDLAIGFPIPGSVSFNLLHKVLYLLALRDGLVSAETDEIELTTSGGIVDSGTKQQDMTQDNVSRTRLTVQRIINGASDQHTLKITGSRIVIANMKEFPSAVIHDAEKIESRISAMSSVVTELEEKVQEMSHQKLDGECAKTLEQLQKRIEILEGLIEQQTSKVTIDEALQTEEPLSSSAAADISDDGNNVSNNLHDAAEWRVMTSAVTCGEDFAEKLTKIIDYLQEIQQKHAHLEEDYQHFKDQQKHWQYAEHFHESENSDSHFHRASQVDPDSKIIEQLRNHLQLVEDAANSRFTRLENLINRLFQEKVNDVDIESRVRQSVQLATRTSSIHAATDGFGVDMISQTNPIVENQLRQLSEMLQASQNEIAALRDALDTKVNIDCLLPVTGAINDQLREVKLEVKSLGTLAKAENNRAAGTKVNTIQNVCCISCDRPVKMDTCTDTVPVPPPAQGASRIIKPSLRYRLEEIRRGFKQQQGSSVGNLEHIEKIYRKLADGKLNSIK
ncbi:uncharacterized protein LOC129727916 [Wyeomyia smithii]|uniref:uncharacterized protein LOC129727916 n=1 Tax=Wyeomyia smithii TaxID=174621 RepID=UPI002467D4C0|nr:uncharacterized protein LOC129727916 [Wyeomyia smithii]